MSAQIQPEQIEKFTLAPDERIYIDGESTISCSDCKRVLFAIIHREEHNPRHTIICGQAKWDSIYYCEDNARYSCGECRCNCGEEEYHIPLLETDGTKIFPGECRASEHAQILNCPTGCMGECIKKLHYDHMRDFVETIRPVMCTDCNRAQFVKITNESKEQFLANLTDESELNDMIMVCAQIKTRKCKLCTDAKNNINYQKDWNPYKKTTCDRYCDGRCVLRAFGKWNSITQDAPRCAEFLLPIKAVNHILISDKLTIVHYHLTNGNGHYTGDGNSLDDTAVETLFCALDTKDKMRVYAHFEIAYQLDCEAHCGGIDGVYNPHITILHNDITIKIKDKYKSDAIASIKLLLLLDPDSLMYEAEY